MKKYLALLLAVVLMFSFVACGKGSGSEDEAVTSADGKSDESQTWEDKTADFKNIDKLSDEPFSFQIYIDGTIIQLPCKISDLEALGYAFEDDHGERILETGYTTSASLFMKNDNYITVSIYNLSGESKTYKDCAVDDISIQESDAEGQKICTSTGITFGDPSEKIKAVYGEIEGDYYEDGEYFFLTYETEDDPANELRFCFRDNSLYEIDVNTRGK